LGRFDPEHKGLDLLLEGLQQISIEERPVVRIMGPDWRGRKAFVTRMVRRLGLSPWVQVGKPVYGAAKKQILAEADAFVYPSRWDACPNAVLESAAMGIPTITTPYPLGRYLADRGGSLLATSSAEGLARALLAAAAPGAAGIGRAGADVAARDLTWDAVARSWLAQAETLS
jgi:glycosyltransferase involved in cell wall biosynthesis